MSIFPDSRTGVSYGHFFESAEAHVRRLEYVLLCLPPRWDSLNLTCEAPCERCVEEGKMERLTDVLGCVRKRPPIRASEVKDRVQKPANVGGVDI